LAQFEYRTVDVFTRERFGGNPLAVFPHADDIDPALFQKIARELNLSETTFVLPSTHPDCDVRVRIFTPAAELPMAGHPTVGTAFVLDRGDRIVFEEGVGPIVVERTGDGRWRMTQPHPVFGSPIDDRASIADALGLTLADLDAALPIQSVSTGVPFLVVPLCDRTALGRLVLQHPRWRPFGTTLEGIYAFTPIGAGEVQSRLVGVAGIPEDPATGGAAGPLGAYLVRHGVVPAGAPARILVRQGIEIGRPSEIHVEVEGSTASPGRVRVAGDCVQVGRAALTL
jgi:trans-2,3-dihydro-3-hydroxyanthranilate isomerase